MIGVTDIPYFNMGWREYGRHPVLPFSRGYWEFQVILEGSCRVQFGNQRWATASAGGLWLFAPDCLHGWTNIPRTQKCRIAVFHFAGVPAVLRSWMREREWFSANVSLRDLIRVSELAMCCPEISECQPPLRQLKVEALLMELSYLLLRDQAEELSVPESTGQRRVQQTLGWMSAHLHEGCGVADAAGAMGLSPQHLRRIFLRETGEGPGRHLTRLRLARAGEILETEDYTLEVIAEAVGYSCAAALSRAIKTGTGKPPRAHRASKSVSGFSPESGRIKNRS